MASWTQTPTRTRELGNGYVIEVGIWKDLNSDGTGPITAQTASSGNPTFCVGDIKGWGFTSDGSHTVEVYAPTTTPQILTITCTAGDTGTYFLIGKGK